MMKQMAEVDITAIAYRGTGAVIPAALSNEVGILIAYLPSSMPHIRSGALRPLAVTSDERSESLPDVPTVAESGVEGYELSSRIGLFAPKDTPDEVIETRSEEHTSEIQSLMRSSYAAFCLVKNISSRPIAYTKASFVTTII